jgi:hypothetical protein
MLVALFILVIFLGCASVFALAGLDHDPLIYASCIAEMTGIHVRPSLLVEMGSCPGWPQASIFLTSASQEAGITDLSHHDWPHINFL